MIELPLIFFAGVLGSSHCIGMSGPLAVALGGRSDSLAENVSRQLIYSTGRIFTYTTLGATAGFAGLWLTSRPTTLVNVQAILAIVAGVLMVVLGLISTGILPPIRVIGTRTPCLSGSWLKAMLGGRGLTHAFLAGLFTGFIPCGLVYSFLALAASTGTVWSGGLTMALFGLGTVPLMVATGTGGTLLNVAVRSRAVRIAAWCVVITGCISLARGFGFLEFSQATVTAGCPLCP